MAGRQEVSGRRGGSFDAFDLALRGGSVTGTVDAATMPRAADRLALESSSVDVTWRIRGCADRLGHAALEIRLDGVAPLVCQRCLQSFSWPIEQSTLVLLARDERELAALDEDDEHEVVLANAPLDALTLVEDELVLTLPFAPRCDRPGCVGGELPGAESGEPRASAFAELAQLRTNASKKARD